MQFIHNRQTVKRIVDIFLIQAVVVVSWGIITGLQMNYFGWNKTSLLFWNQLQKNEFAAYLGFVLVLSLAVISKTEGKNVPLRKITAFMLIFLVPFAWIFTYSRSGLLGIMAAFSIFIVLDQGKKLTRLMIRWLPFICLVFLIVLVAFSFEAKDLAWDGLLSIIQPANARFERNVANIQSRIDLMEVALDIIVTHPLRGIDYSQWLTYAPLESGYLDPQLGERVVVGVVVHNRYLSIAVKSGLITLFAYLGLLIVVFKVALKARRYADPWLRTYINALLAAVIGYQISLLFIPEYLWEWPILGILLGLIHVSGIEGKTGQRGKTLFKSYRVVWKNL
ncbi:MAG: O-antigen ligase family protein, partial [Candidatus Heimdallarchaeota archaeon]|nr:O-antigen ligase family protein [Candidatus Heimdallarchaeota archaeon]